MDDDLVMRNERCWLRGFKIWNATSHPTLSSQPKGSVVLKAEGGKKEVEKLGRWEDEKAVRSRKSDPSSSDKAGLPSSLFELRRDMMPWLKMRPPASPSCRL